MGFTPADMTMITLLLIVVGVAGSIVPVLPGPALVVGAVLLWALVWGTYPVWTIAVIVCVLVGAGSLVKYFTAGRSMRTTGVPTRSMIAAGLVAVIGFFVIPVVGLFIGFALGLFGAERLRLSDSHAARQTTIAAVKSVGVGIAIELSTVMIAAVIWGVAVFAFGVGMPGGPM